MSEVVGMDLREVVAEAGERSGTIWALMHSDDLNANLVRFPTGRGVEEHVNDELEVFFLGVSGSGVATVDKDEYVVSPGRMIFIPKGARRSTLSASENFAYLSIHRKRGTLQIGR